MNIFHKRQGQMEIAQSYFYTDTIQGFKNLLEDDIIKMIIIDSLQYLTNAMYFSKGEVLFHK